MVYSLIDHKQSAITLAYFFSTLKIIKKVTLFYCTTNCIHIITNNKQTILDTIGNFLDTY